MKDLSFQGVFPYLVSPVDAQGNIIEDALARLVDHLVRSGTIKS